MKYFRIKHGYGNMDFLSIEESELRNAIGAQISGQVLITKSGTVSGNSIISITPDYQRDMGWNADYNLNGEDYDYIGKAKVNEYRELLQNTIEDVSKKIGDGGRKLIQ